MEDKHVESGECEKSSDEGAVRAAVGEHEQTRNSQMIQEQVEKIGDAEKPMDCSIEIEKDEAIDGSMYMDTPTDSQVTTIEESTAPLNQNPLLIPEVAKGILENFAVKRGFPQSRSPLDTKTLKNCRLVCTTWNNLAAPVLYNQTCLTSYGTEHLNLFHERSVQVEEERAKPTMMFRGLQQLGKPVDLTSTEFIEQFRSSQADRMRSLGFKVKVDVAESKQIPGLTEILKKFPKLEHLKIVVKYWNEEIRQMRKLKKQKKLKNRKAVEKIDKEVKTSSLYTQTSASISLAHAENLDDEDEENSENGMDDDNSENYGTEDEAEDSEKEVENIVTLNAIEHEFSMTSLDISFPFFRVYEEKIRNGFGPEVEIRKELLTSVASLVNSCPALEILSISNLYPTAELNHLKQVLEQSPVFQNLKGLFFKEDTRCISVFLHADFWLENFFVSLPNNLEFLSVKFLKKNYLGWEQLLPKWPKTLKGLVMRWSHKIRKSSSMKQTLEFRLILSNLENLEFLHLKGCFSDLTHLGVEEDYVFEHNLKYLIIGGKVLLCKKGLAKILNGFSNLRYLQLNLGNISCGILEWLGYALERNVPAGLEEIVLVNYFEEINDLFRFLCDRRRADECEEEEEEEVGLKAAEMEALDKIKVALGKAPNFKRLELINFSLKPEVNEAMKNVGFEFKTDGDVYSMRTRRPELYFI